MIEILPPLGKYKYDTWRIVPVKCYIDNSVRLRSYIRNVNIDDEEAPCEALQRMVIRDVRPQDPSEPQAPNDTTPPTQDHE
jgi:hypothetical protein